MGFWWRVVCGEALPPKREIFSSSPVIWKQLRRRLSAVETHSSPDQGLLLLLPSATPKCFSCLCQVLLLSPKNATLASTKFYSKMLLLLHTPPSPHPPCLFRIHVQCIVQCIGLCWVEYQLLLNLMLLPTAALPLVFHQIVRNIKWQMLPLLLPSATSATAHPICIECSLSTETITHSQWDAVYCKQCSYWLQCSESMLLQCSYFSAVKQLYCSASFAVQWSRPRTLHLPLQVKNLENDLPSIKLRTPQSFVYTMGI